MEFSQEDYNCAVSDFLEGNGEGLPGVKTCKVLMHFHKGINNKIKNSLEEKLDSISVMPYGDKVIFAENPVYQGPFTTSMYIESNGHRMDVHFDRN